MWAWARTEARIVLLSEYLLTHDGDLAPDDTSRRASDLLTRLEARAESLRSKLGFDPLSRGRLGRDVASMRVDLAALGDVGAQLLAAHGQDDAMRALAPVVEDDGDQPPRGAEIEPQVPED